MTSCRNCETWNHSKRYSDPAISNFRMPSIDALNKLLWTKHAQVFSHGSKISFNEETQYIRAETHVFNLRYTRWFHIYRVRIFTWVRLAHSVFAGPVHGLLCSWVCPFLNSHLLPLRNIFQVFFHEIASVWPLPTHCITKTLSPRKHKVKIARNI